MCNPCQHTNLGLHTRIFVKTYPTGCSIETEFFNCLFDGTCSVNFLLILVLLILDKFNVDEHLFDASNSKFAK